MRGIPIKSRKIVVSNSRYQVAYRERFILHLADGASDATMVEVCTVIPRREPWSSNIDSAANRNSHDQVHDGVNRVIWRKVRPEPNAVISDCRLELAVVCGSLVII